MNNQIHYLIIGIIIAIILGTQVLVFFNTLKKINLFNSIFPQVKNFKTIKVYIPENQLDEISLESVWQNLEIYSDTPVNSSNSDILSTFSNDYENNKSTPGINKYIIIKKGGEQKRINSNYFEDYYKEGWKFYKDDDILTSNINNSKKLRRTVTVSKGPVTEKVGVDLANVYQKAGWTIIENNNE